MIRQLTRKRLLGISTLSLALLLTACGEEEKTEPFASHFTGMYVGELPCADCFGILTHATFFNDHRVAITSLYYDSDETSETEWGSWAIEKNILKASMPDNIVNHYIQLTDEIIMMTDDKGKPSEMLAEHYQLKKMVPLKAENFAGQYHQTTSSDPDAYRQTLTITPISSGSVTVSVNATGAGKGCEFTGNGNIINDQIEVDLHKVNSDMNSTMVIRPTDGDNALYLFTSRFDDRYDLMYFCGGGGSLMGDYIKDNSSTKLNTH